MLDGGTPVHTRSGRPQRGLVDRGVWIQAVALFTFISADGFGILRLGGPVWLTYLCVGLGIVVATGRLRLRARREPGEPARAEREPSRAPTVAPPSLPQARAPRAVGYVRVTR